MIRAEPGATAVTLPLELTVATLVSEDSHSTLSSVALAGYTEALRYSLSPTSSVRLLGSTVTLETLISGVTVTLQVAVFPL